MARIAGKSANFSFNGPQIEDELNSMEMTVDVELPEVTSFGDAAGVFVEGLPNSKFAVSGFFDGVAAQGDATIFGQIGSGSAALVFDPTGSGPDTNAPTYGGTAFVKTYRVRAEVGGAVTYSADFQLSGANTRDVTA